MRTIAATTISALKGAVELRDFILAAVDVPFAALLVPAPWKTTSTAKRTIRNAIGSLAGYAVQDGIADHRTATVGSGAVKGIVVTR